MPSENEKLIRSFKRTGLALGIILGVFFIKDFSPFPIGYADAFIAILLSLRLLFIARKIQKNPHLTKLLDDEYMQHLNLKSYRISYVVFIVITVLLLFFKDIFTLSAEEAVEITLAALLSVPGIVFFILERKM